MRMAMTAALVAAALAGAGNPGEVKIAAPDGSEVTLRGPSLSRAAGGDVTAAGRSEFVHGELRVDCAGTAIVKTSGGYFRSFAAAGAIEAKAGRKSLRGRRLEYEEARHLVTLSGSPEVSEEGTISRADRRILLYLETGVMQCEPRPMISVDRSRHREKPKPRRGKFLGLF